MRLLNYILCALLLMSFVACGGGGSSKGTGSAAGAPGAGDSAYLAVEKITVQGHAAWPAAGTVTVRVNGNPVVVDNGMWTADLVFTGDQVRSYSVELLADGVIVEASEVIIERRVVAK